MGIRLSEKNLCRLGAELVAERYGFVVFIFPPSDGSKWRNVCVRSKAKVEGKRSWWIAHNGERFAGCSDMDRLPDGIGELVAEILGGDE